MCVPDCCDTKERPRASEVTPYEKRFCTDVLFLAVFLAFWVAIAAIVGNAKSMGGSPYKIIHGSDWEGRICGIDWYVKDYPYAAWPDPESAADVKVCVVDCNATETWAFTIKFKTRPLSYFCVPTTNLSSGVTVTINGSFDDSDQSASRAMGDMVTTWPVIFVSAFFALAISFFYCWLARQLADCMVWTIVILMSLAGFLTGYALISAAKSAQDEGVDTNRSKALNGMGIALVIATFIFLLTVFAMRKRIKIAIEIVKEAARALEEVPAMAFFPIVPFFTGIAFIVCWIIIALYIFSVSVPQSKPVNSVYIKNEFANFTTYHGNYTDLVWDKNLKNAFAIHFFYLLWVIQFLVYFCYMVIAGAIATWYFTRYDGNGNKNLPERVTWNSAKRTCRFHLGSIALGSGILAIIQFIRMVLRYLEWQTKRVEANRLQICVFRLIQCCLSCVECCCDKINKNGYVWMAVFGHSFIPSVCNSWMLIWRNLIRIAAVHLVGEYVLLCGKVIVSLLTTGLAGLIMKGVYQDEISSIAMPCFVVFILSFLVATIFMQLFDTTIDTVFLCFLIDEEMNKASGQMFAAPSLQSLIDAHAQTSQEMATQTLAFRQQKLGQAAPSNPLPPASSATTTTATVAPSGGFVGSTPDSSQSTTRPNVY